MIRELFSTLIEFYHVIFKFIIPGSLISLPLIKWKVYDIKEFQKYLFYNSNSEIITILVLAYLFGYLITYAFDPILHRWYFSYYNHFYKILHHYKKSIIAESDPFIGKRDIIRKDINNDFGIELNEKDKEEKYEKYKLLLWKAMSKYPNVQVKSNAQTWGIFSKNMIVSTIVYTIILLFAHKIDFISYDSAAIVVFLGIILFSWIISNQWIAHGLIYSYYFAKENERRQVQFIKTMAKK